MSTTTTNSCLDASNDGHNPSLTCPSLTDSDQATLSNDKNSFSDGNSNGSISHRIINTSRGRKMGTTAPNDKGKQVDGQQGARDDTGTFLFLSLLH